MLRPKLSALFAATVTIAGAACAFNTGAVGRQEKTNDQPSGTIKAKPNEKSAPDSATVEADKAEAVIEKMLAEYDLKPHALPSIPDNPPPREGAMVALPHIIEPPDLVLVEVLEALPGRPISGERLVRPDGTINLGFYGDVPVKGLTLEQAKVAIIKHLRQFLGDDMLGLIEPVDLEGEATRPAGEMPAVPVLPKADQKSLDLREKAKPRASTGRTVAPGRPARPRAASYRPARSHLSVRPVSRVTSGTLAQENVAAAPAPSQITVPTNGSGRVTVTIQVDGQGLPLGRAVPEAPPVGDPENERWILVPPEKSTRVFLDVTAYNTRNYYVLGDVQIVGRLPWTSNETVLDALQFAGGVLASAEPNDIRLIRPARGGKPARVYKVDLAAIQDKGDVTSNYQLFPGDRLIVGRNEVVKKTVEIDRLAAPILSISGVTLQEAFVLKALQNATVANRDELLKEYVDFWVRELARPGGVKLDEQTLREAFIRRMKLPPSPQVNLAPR